MSSAIRLSIILVLLLATAALGLIAMNLYAPRATVAAGAAGPTTVAYFVAARPLTKGTLARDQDFALRSSAPDQVPPGAIVDTPDAKASLPGSLVRNFLDVGTPVTMQDILRPSDRGFLASVLAPDTRAISIKVDEESGVSGLIRPGDFVDVILTQVFDKDKEETKRALSETVLGNIRVIAIDQEIAQGARQENPEANAQGKKAAAPVVRPAGKFSQTISLELAPEQVKRITVARQLGKLSLVIRAAVDQWNKKDVAVSGCDVSAEVARQNAVAGQRASIVIHTAGDVKEYFVKKEHFDADVLCDDSSAAARPVADAGLPGRTIVKRR
jgi:pilus assembly protein CpaB